MGKFCFIILHYNTIKETKRCVQSILNLEADSQMHIIIVDNASPNGTGKELLDCYQNDKRIDVLLNTQNWGFSIGNNIGCEFAIHNYKPDYLIIANNDIVFEQRDILQCIEKEYKQSSFDVLAVDIYNPHKNQHQNPLSLSIPAEIQIDRTIKYNDILYKYFTLLYPIIWLYYWWMDHHAKDSEYKEYQEDICPMGACLIISKKMYEGKKKIFYPETQFYYEENILTLWCKRNNKRIVYTPDIQVIHNEGVATASVSQHKKEVLKMRIQRILESAKVYKSIL